MASRTIRALVVLVACLAAAAAAVPASSAASRGPLPARLAHVAGSGQVVVATAAGWSTSYAQLQAWQRGPDGRWRLVLGPVPARIGWNGFAAEASRLQSSGETPAGTFRLLRGFGLAEPAGVTLPYRLLDANDWWPYDPKDPSTYNVFQPRRPPKARWRTSWAEDLDSYTRQYRYAVVLDYNLPSGIHVVDGERVASRPADTTKGGGIFLHVRSDGPTAGCVAVARADMRWLLRWLDPVQRPVLVMGPSEVIERM